MVAVAIILVNGFYFHDFPSLCLDFTGINPREAKE